MTTTSCLGTCGLVLACLMAGAVPAVCAEPQIIPQPVSLVRTTGSYPLGGDQMVAVIATDAAAADVARRWAERLGQAIGSPVTVQTAAGATGGLRLALLPDRDATIGDEGYRLKVAPEGITISANRPAGLFYGTQTLSQLLPPEAEAAASGRRRTFQVPCLEVVDHPRFAWRGLLLDVSRHFFTKAEVKSYIDQMARFKFNVFHWHLSDDQGWRVEIKKYPKLTEVGAWRVPRQGVWWSFAPPQPNEKATEGGFYTQDEVREIVAYAKERFVDILPEVDVPGHSMAALASYPELSCGGGPFTVNPGSQFYGRIENGVCPGQDLTYNFYNDVVAELAALFPFKYFHMGGDEACHGFWNKCPRCQAVCKEHKLADSSQLQSHFVRRLEKIIESHGKNLLGWDEILMGGLSPNATVMSWRGVAGGVNAAKQNHDVIMAASPYYYLDLYQGDPLVEPNTYSLSTLKMAYDFEPVPAGVDSKHILGIQGCLWSESVPTFRHAQYMTWPRGLAIAETAWSPASHKNWTDFTARVEGQFARFRVADWNYAPSMFDVTAEVKRAADGSLSIGLTSEADNLDIHYTFTIANPDAHYPRYESPLKVPPGASELRVVTCRQGQVLGRQRNFPISELEKKAGK